MNRNFPPLVCTFAGLAAATAAACAFMVWSDYRQDLAAAHARVASGSEVASTPCGPIEYAVLGNGAPVLVAHGAGGGFDQGLELGRPLAQAGFRAISVSRFGYLRTPLPTDATPAAQAEAYACLLDALKISRVAMLGVSAGAPSSLQFCLGHPERCSALVLLVPATAAPRPANDAPLPAMARFLLDAMLGSDFAFWAMANLSQEQMLEKLFGTPAADFRRAWREEQERVLRIVRQLAPVSRRAEGVQNDLAVLASAPRAEVERITAPTLVVSAANDLFGTWDSGRALAARIPGARFSGFPDGGHLLVGHYAQVVAEIALFLNRLPVGPAVGDTRRRRLSLVMPARDPLGHEHRLLPAFALHAHVPGGLHTAVDVFHRGKLEARPNARARRNGTGEAHAIQPVVDSEPQSPNLDGLAQQVREQ
jgi:2-hydroxy-6-oxonona-2,4-dienedioate hydrolase